MRIGRFCLLMALLALAPEARAQAPEQLVDVSNTAGLSSSPAAVIDQAGTLHIAWSDSDSSTNLADQFVLYTRSHDGGATFDQPRRISSPDGAARRSARLVRVAVSSSGAIVLAWWDTTFDGSNRAYDTAFVSLSRDGGATFGPPADTTLRFRADVAQKEGYTNLTSLSVATGPGGQVYLLATVQDYYHGFNIYFARSADGSQFAEPVRLTNYSGTIPRAAANALALLPAGEIYAVWTESNGDFVDEIKNNYFASSTDGGRSFSAPMRVGGARGVAGAILARGGDVRLLTQFQNGPRANHRIRLYTSEDRGRSFPTRAATGVAASNSHLNQSSIADNGHGTVAVAWVENSSRPGPPEGIYVARSTDNGATFAEPVRVAAGIFPDPPAVVVDAVGRIGVVFASSALDAADREIVFTTVSP